MASLRQALSDFSANEDRVSGIKTDRAQNIINSEERKSDRLVQSLSSFSSTLAETLIKRDERKIEDEIKRGRALQIEHDLEKMENEGVSPVAPEEKEQFEKDKEYLKEADSLAKHTAKQIIDNGGDFEDSQKVANLSGWALYAYTAQKAHTAGKNYQAWMEGEMLDDDKTQIELDGVEFTPKTAKTLNQKRAAMKVLRQRYAEVNDLDGVNRTLLAEEGGYYDQVGAANTEIVAKYKKQYAIEKSFQIKQGAINTFKANKNYEELFNSLLTVDPEGDGTALTFEQALDEVDSIVEDLMDTEEFGAEDLERMGNQEVIDPTTGKKGKLRDVRKSRFRKLEEKLVEAQQDNFNFSEQKKENLFTSDVQKLKEKVLSLNRYDYSSEWLRDEYQKLKAKHGKHFQDDEMDSIISQHAKPEDYEQQLGQAEDLKKAGLLTTKELRKFDLDIQKKYEDDARRIDAATSKENKVDLQYLKDRVEFAANESALEKNDPSVALMQAHIEAKYQQELAKAVLAGDPNASQTARNVVDQWFTGWSSNLKNLNEKGYQVPNMPTPKEIKQQSKHNANEIKRQNETISKYGSKEAGGLGNLLKPENIVRLIPPERLVESAQAYAEVGPLGFNYPAEVENIYRRFGSRQNTKHNIYKQIIEGTLGVKLGDPPPSVVKLEKYTSKADQIYLKEGGTDASTRFWGYTGQVSGMPNIEIVPDGVGEIVFNLSQESGMPFGELASGYEFFKANPKVAEVYGVSTTGKIDWNRFGLAMMHIKNQTGRGFQMAGEGAQAFGEGVVDFTENIQGRLSQFAEDTRTEVDAALEESLANNLSLGEGLSGKAAGDWIAEQLINLGVDISKFGSDQVNNLINSILGDVPNLDEDQIRSFNNAAFKYEPSPENLNATKRARY